jgi:hypothetical protein
VGSFGHPISGLLRVSITEMPWLDPSKRSRCPCCGYPTLGARGEYEICRICWWEDDGQDDADADVFRGGPNQGYSLTQARENFRRFGVMYEPECDPRIGAPDSELANAAKQALMAAFKALEGSAPDVRQLALAEIRRQERALDQELKRKIREHDQRCRESRALERKTD